MKVPFPPNNQFNNSPFEPKSVLDLRGSPSPVSNITAAAGGNILTVDPLHLADDHHVLNIDPQFDDLDYLMSDWALHEDSYTKPFSQILNSNDKIQITNHDHHQDIHSYSNNNNLSDFPNNYNSVDFGLISDIDIHIYTTPPLNNINTNFIDSFEHFSGGFDYVDELIRLAECLDEDSLQLGQGILARLNQRLRSPDGKPLQRAAFYFKEALQSLITGSARPAHRAASSFEIVQTIKAQKTFSSVSPIPMFSGFTASQAVLEALDGSGGVRIHVVDFDIGLGGHWASFMRDLSSRYEWRSDAAPEIRISAVVPEGYAAESRLIRESLSLFARDLSITFDIEFISIGAFEYLYFAAFKFTDGEKVAVILSPAIFRHVGTGFLSDLRQISPHVVVHVDAEGGIGFGTASYSQTVAGGLEFYSTLLESLESANFNGGGDWMRRIEELVVWPKIVEAVEAAGSGGRRGLGWSEAAGLRQVGLSQFGEFEAECLVRRVQVRGFHVAKRQEEMVLCWHDRPIVATSAWRF